MVSVAWSTTASTGPESAAVARVMVGGVRPQPKLMTALQVAVLITETVPSLPFPTYAVWVAWSTATATGLPPTTIARPPRPSGLPRESARLASPASWLRTLSQRDNGEALDGCSPAETTREEEAYPTAAVAFPEANAEVQMTT